VEIIEDSGFPFWSRAGLVDVFDTDEALTTGGSGTVICGEGGESVAEMERPCGRGRKPFSVRHAFSST